VDLNIALDAYAPLWLKRVSAGIKARTLESYGTILRIHVLPGLGPMRLRDLSRGHIKDLISTKLESGLSRNTVRLIRATFHALLNEAVEDGIIQVNPAAKRGHSKTFRLAPTQGEREEKIKAMTREELGAFLSSAVRVEPRAYPLLFTMAQTGLLWAKPWDFSGETWTSTTGEYESPGPSPTVEWRSRRAGNREPWT
jgi:integrase